MFLMLHSKTIGFVIKHNKFGMIFAPPQFRNNPSDILAKDTFGQEHVDILVSFAKKHGRYLGICPKSSGVHQHGYIYIYYIYILWKLKNYSDGYIPKSCCLHHYHIEETMV